MPTLAQIRQIEAALKRLSSSAQRDFLELWTGADTEYRRKRLVFEVFPSLVERYGSLASALAADVFEAEATELGIEPRVELAPGVNADRASARLSSELKTTTTLASSLALVDELVKQPYRSTYQDSAIGSGAGWARVPRGKTCQFCNLLASRGGVYTSKEVAVLGFRGKAYHGDCDCQPVLVRGPEDYPPGYDPDAMYEKYKAVHVPGMSGREAVAAMRAAYGGH